MSQVGSPSNVISEFQPNLAYRLRPGSALLSTRLLGDVKVVNMVTTSVAGTSAAEAYYTPQQAEWNTKDISNVVYLPKTAPTRESPPILVVVQSMINQQFLQDLIDYSTTATRQYGVLPTAFVISLNGYTNDDIQSSAQKEGYFESLPCQFWAQKCLILSPSSIESFICENPMKDIVALGHFFIQRKNCINDLKEKEDPTIKLLYFIAEESALEDVKQSSKAESVSLIRYQKVQEIFENIKNLTEDTPNAFEIIKQHAVDGVNQLQEYIDEIERPMTQEFIEDFDYVEAYQRHFRGKKRMSWTACFLKGRNDGVFKDYTTASSLKAAYHRKHRKSKHKKHNS